VNNQKNRYDNHGFESAFIFADAITAFLINSDLDTEQNVGVLILPVELKLI